MSVSDYLFIYLVIGLLGNSDIINMGFESWDIYYNMRIGHCKACSEGIDYIWLILYVYEG